MTQTQPAPAEQSAEAWNRVQCARDARRPKAMDLAEALFDDVFELHGDRLYGDDPAVFCALARFDGRPVTVIAQCKGRSVEENMHCCFGMPHPEGYRKGLRAARQAEKFRRPVICIVDTAGAYPGKGAEERGQAAAIARCLAEFSSLQTPVISLVLSEGGSGGALAFSVADRVLMMENAVYSILSPEGFASILWKDASRAQEAAGAMKLTSQDILEAGLADEIIPEPEGGLQSSPLAGCRRVRRVLKKHLDEILNLKLPVLLKQRARKYRNLGDLPWTD